jgi:hypothetical protein
MPTHSTQRKQDAKSANQNSGVQIKAYDSENHAQTYYGFWCKCVRVPKGVMMDKYGMCTIDFKHLAYLDEPFIFANDVVQVFYGKNLGDGGGGHVVLQVKRKIIGVKDTNEEEGNGYRDMPALGLDVDLPLFVEGNEPAYVRSDHNEAAYVK